MGTACIARLARGVRPAKGARARNASPVPARLARASASAVRETAPARREGNVTATALVATVTVRMIREEGHNGKSERDCMEEGPDGHPVGTGNPCHKDEDFHRPFLDEL